MRARSRRWCVSSLTTDAVGLDDCFGMLPIGGIVNIFALGGFGGLGGFGIVAALGMDGILPILVVDLRERVMVVLSMRR